MRSTATMKIAKQTLRPSADGVNGTSTWTNMSGLTSAMKLAVKSSKASHTREVFYAINVRYTRRMALPKQLSSAPIPTAIDTRVRASLARRISMNTFAGAMSLNLVSLVNSLPRLQLRNL
jgi:hypothetical protein